MNDRQLKTKWAQLNWRSRIAYLSIVFVLLFIPFVRIVLETLFGVELNSFLIIVIAWGFSVLANLIAVEWKWLIFAAVVPIELYLFTSRVIELLPL
ncbi:hypothetical protein DOPI104051_06290 [Dolosigranulum pigrum]|jgi:hypothetical protein|uniref:Uncharacterized protein n=2 Tax=Dolosigranulum pigrum TaxID=29394 RepID=H3NEP4_9LACT|nr:hypothetical protein [Dolosigranulum pigrum]EHR32909.1 hypothetical protein HMPREF9703_01025 [Dolosigranulum pigrum ATCC 51524]QJS96460.1 hypothetical protein B5772_05895 [Dolosigranulum pigrum]QTJ36384.1 hypothetical protein FE323_04990 [Dolosigranulum pigrum]QTJ44395.1 hypothetical protein FE328_01850 [Dolosigranulum pigrum]